MRRPAVTFVVMAGGRGERLWPLVRAARPKVCVSPDGRQTLLEATIGRLRSTWPGAQWLIVTTREQGEAVRAGLPAALRRGVMVEPQIKNTAACITAAAVTLAARDPRRVMVVVPADHWVADVPAFRRSVRAAIRAAVVHDTIATIGVRPSHPHAGLGYLCAGPAVRAGRSAVRVFRLARFIEKPSPRRAAQLLAAGRTYWNIGIFVGTADKFLECVTEWLPEHTRRLVPLAYGIKLRGFVRRARRAYRALQAVSFDYGVMDHVRGGLIVEGRFPWADLGSWDTWARLGRASSQSLHLDSRGITVVGQGRHLVATIGVRNLLVIHTPLVTLVCRPERAQAVRELTRRLEASPKLRGFR